MSSLKSGEKKCTVDRLGAEVLKEGLAGAEILEFAIFVSEIFRSEVCGSRAIKIIFFTANSLIY